MHPEMSHLSQLPVSERLEIVEQLWDSIAESKETLPIQEWQREIVKARLDDFENGKTTGLTRQQVWEQVEKKRES